MHATLLGRIPIDIDPRSNCWRLCDPSVGPVVCTHRLLELNRTFGHSVATILT